MSAREEILQRIGKKQEKAIPPPVWQSRRHFSDLPAQFSQALTAAHGEVIAVKDHKEAETTLKALWRSLGAQKIVVNTVPEWADFDWQKKWPKLTWHMVNEITDAAELRNFSAQADVGISG